jgi:hypothetical protein
VISGPDSTQVMTAACWNACLWGGRYNCIIPAYDAALADNLVRCFGVDVLLPVQANPAVTTFIDRFPHLSHERWRDTIFERQRCEYADIRHTVRRIVALQDRDAQTRIRLPTWQEADTLASLFATELPNGEIDLDVSMLVQPGDHLVVGASAQDLPYARGIKHRFPPEFGDGTPQTVLLTPGRMTVMVKRAADNWAPAATKGFSIQLKP